MPSGRRPLLMRTRRAGATFLLLFLHTVAGTKFGANVGPRVASLESKTGSGGGTSRTSRAETIARLDAAAAGRSFMKNQELVLRIKELQTKVEEQEAAIAEMKMREEQSSEASPSAEMSTSDASTSPGASDIMDTSEGRTRPESEAQTSSGAASGSQQGSSDEDPHDRPSASRDDEDKDGFVLRAKSRKNDFVEEKEEKQRADINAGLRRNEAAKLRAAQARAVALHLRDRITDTGGDAFFSGSTTDPEKFSPVVRERMMLRRETEKLLKELLAELERLSSTACDDSVLAAMVPASTASSSLEAVSLYSPSGDEETESHLVGPTGTRHAVRAMPQPAPIPLEFDIATPPVGSPRSDTKLLAELLAELEQHRRCQQPNSVLAAMAPASSTASSTAEVVSVSPSADEERETAESPGPGPRTARNNAVRILQPPAPIEFDIATPRRVRSPRGADGGTDGAASWTDGHQMTPRRCTRRPLGSLGSSRVGRLKRVVIGALFAASRYCSMAAPWLQDRHPGLTAALLAEQLAEHMQAVRQQEQQQEAETETLCTGHRLMLGAEDEEFLRAEDWMTDEELERWVTEPQAEAARIEARRAEEKAAEAEITAQLEKLQLGDDEGAQEEKQHDDQDIEASPGPSRLARAGKVIGKGCGGLFVLNTIIHAALDLARAYT